MLDTTGLSRAVVMGLVLAMAVSVSACLPASSDRGDGSEAPEIADQAEYEAVRDKARQTMDRAMDLAMKATGAEFAEPDDPTSVVTGGCDLRPENVQDVTVVSGLRYRGPDAGAAAQAIAQAWREAGWDASVAEETAVGFTTDLGSGVAIGLGLSRVAEASDGDGLVWRATATSDCMELPEDVAERIAIGDLE